MADGRVEPTTPSVRTKPVWTEIFRSFQVALDPRKLFLAAAGILATAIGWYILSSIFYSPTPPDRNAEKYQSAAIASMYGENLSETDRAIKGNEEYNRDLAQWRTLEALAGPNGSIRTMPWSEYRGENPYLFATKQADNPNAGRVLGYIIDQIPFLIEPLSKLLLPIIKLLDPTASFLTRIYLLLALLWSVAVWAFFGGVITRIAAVQFAGKEQITIRQAIKFVTTRYVSYVLSPVVPLAIITVIVLCMSLYGLVALIPILGDVILYGLGFPLVILGGIVMAILLLGLVGYPLMYTTISSEGSDTFDALSRAYNYVFQAPWHYLWYALVAVVYGAIVTFVVIVVGCLTVYLGKWAISQPASLIASNRKPDFLFVYSPDSYGWRELMLKGSPVEVRPKFTLGLPETPVSKVRVTYEPVRQAEHDQYMKEMEWWNKVGAAMATFWMVLIFLLMIGFSYSYFWSASTMIYLLMRKKVDEVELDEVYVEDESAPPIGPPPPVSAPSSPPAPGATNLPTIPAPAPAAVSPPEGTALPPSAILPDDR